MSYDGPVIDAWVNLNTPALAGGWGEGDKANLERWFHDSIAEMEAGTSVDEMVASMDESNVEKCLITPPSYVYDFDSVDEECSVVSDVAEQYPERFGGALMLENTREDTRRFVTSVEEYGFVAGRIMPSMVGDSGVPPTDRGFSPIYHEAEKRDIPLTINAGIPGPIRPARTQRPLHLDDICLEFPDLTIVATHMGDPWSDELVALCNKHPNLHMMTSAWKPEYYPENVVEYLNSSRGIDDVMYASDWPLLDWTDTLPQVSDLELSPEATRKFLYDNASRIFDM